VKILAIRLARFGDIVLLLPALSHLKACLPDSHLTFLTDQRWEPLAAMCPAVDDIVTIDRLGMRDGKLGNALAGIRRAGRLLRGGGFDAVIDFHGFRETNLMAWWSGAGKRIGLRRFDQSYWGWCFNLPPVNEDKNIHVSEMFLRVARAFADRSPAGSSPSALVVPPSALEWARQKMPRPPYVALYVDGPVKDRIWPRERFDEVARHFFTEKQVPAVVLSAADGLSIPQLAAAIGSASLLISNDTGPMHLGPALGVPTLGIFSVGFPEHFRPIGAKDLWLRGNPIEAVKTAEVIEAASRIWAGSVG
jgi:ADP-heptose:LPS heptosyltransferase